MNFPYRAGATSVACRSLRRFTCVAIFALATMQDVRAASPSLPPELTLADALQATAQHNPQLRAFDFDLLAGEGRRVQAGLRRNPELGLEFENFAGSGDVSGSEALETTLTLSQLIELGGKRTRRIALAESETEVVRADHAIRRLDVLAEVTRRFVRLVADQEQLALQRRSTDLNEQFFNAVSVRVRAARSPIAEQTRAQIALARARLESARAERTLESSRRALAAMWGAPKPDFEKARADLEQRPALADFDSLAERLAANPLIARYLSEQRLRESELQLARAERRSDLTVAGGIRRFEQGGDHAFVMSFSAPLTLFNRNEGSIREAQARLDKLALERESALIDANAELFGLYQDLEQARVVAQALRSELIPSAREALAQTEYGYDRGRFSYLEVAEAQRELVEFERARIEAAARFHLLLAEIERLTGEPLAAH